jgi:hypothetical protein
MPTFGGNLFPTRRQLLQVGVLSPLGLSLPGLLHLEARADPRRDRRGRTKSCIFLFLYGGPSQLDTWDMKPSAPAEIRGPFEPIPTSVPGIQICEYLPRMARLARHYSLVRTLTHSNRNHQPAGSWMLTGVNPENDNASQLKPRPDDPPGLGSLAARLAPGSGGLPAFVMMPAKLFDQGSFFRGQAAGWLGTAYDPLLIKDDPNAVDFQLEEFRPAAELGRQRLQRRRDLLAGLDEESRVDDAAARSMGQFQERAMDLLTSTGSRDAFDLASEPAGVRDRYGRTTFGQGCLLARRLIEAGVRLVTVSDCTPRGHHQWDTHNNNFRTLRSTLLPKLDQAYSALLEDLIDRGLLEDTVVYVGGEFGRTPRIGQSTGAGAGSDGRDHWPNCFTGVLAGGLTRRGLVYGTSDSRAAYPRENPVTPEDLAATLFRAMGLDPDTVVQSRDGRPMVVSHGRPITALLA